MKDNLIDKLVKDFKEDGTAELLQKSGLPLEGLINSKLNAMPDLAKHAAEYLKCFESDLTKWSMSGKPIAVSENGRMMVTAFLSQVAQLQKLEDTVKANAAELSLSDEILNSALAIVPNVTYMTVYSFYQRANQITQGEFFEFINNDTAIILS